MKGIPDFNYLLLMTWEAKSVDMSEVGRISDDLLVGSELTIRAVSRIYVAKSTFEIMVLADLFYSLVTAKAVGIVGFRRRDWLTTPG
jgi:hypothetical protein